MGLSCSHPRPRHSRHGIAPLTRTDYARRRWVVRLARKAAGRLYPAQVLLQAAASNGAASPCSSTKSRWRKEQPCEFGTAERAYSRASRRCAAFAPIFTLARAPASRPWIPRSTSPFCDEVAEGKPASRIALPALSLAPFCNFPLHLFCALPTTGSGRAPWYPLPAHAEIPTTDSRRDSTDLTPSETRP